MAATTLRYRSVLSNMGRRNYHMLMKTSLNSQKLETHKDIVEFRKQVLHHFKDYGIKSTLSTFSNISRSTIYDWKRKYQESKFNDIALIPKSTKPKQLRVMTTDIRLIEFIIAYRSSFNYGFLGKEKLKLFVDEYASSLGIKSISTGTIGKIIKRKHLDKNTHANSCKKVKRQKKFVGVNRIKHAPKINSPGYIEVDCVIICLNSQTHYFVCLIDIFTRFAHVVKVASLRSSLALQALTDFKVIYQEKTNFTIHSIQTDNGSEFLSVFHQYCLENKLKHIFTYPSSPRINGVVEKFNCTLQKEFLERSDELFAYDSSKFNLRLIAYLRWYNEIRPHSSLKNQNIITFIKNYQSNMYVT